VAFVLLLGCAYMVGPGGRLDAIALHGLGTLRGSWTDPVAQLATHLADPLPLLAMLAGLVAWGWATGRRREAVAAVALVAGASVTTQVLKVALAHPRIQPVLGPYQLGPEAFPSGHATAAMSIGLAAVLVAPIRFRAMVAVAATTYVIAASTSLLILGWHFPSDVLGGLLVASAFFFGTVAALQAAGPRRVGLPGRARLTATPPIREAALVALAGIGVFAVLRADDLLSFARLHTVAAATALAIILASAGLLIPATLVADDHT
jgi:membrane-associated phospholipid phosphatase